MALDALFSGGLGVTFEVFTLGGAASFAGGADSGIGVWACSPWGMIRLMRLIRMMAEIFFTCVIPKILVHLQC